MQFFKKTAFVILAASQLTACSTFLSKPARDSMVDSGAGPSAEVGYPTPMKIEQMSVPEEVNRYVLKWVDYFQTKGRPHMVRYLGRSTRYIPMMKAKLKEHGLPDDLVYLAMIESGFNSRAFSRAACVGQWQFLASTGRRYGLKINRLVDERRDPEKATDAAALYLKGLYNLFGDWLLAMASYNVGENKVQRAVMRNATRDYWKLVEKRQLPRETLNYVPKFIAARMIAQDPRKYGFDNLEFESPLAYELIESSQTVSLSKLSSNSGIDLQTLKELNPLYRTDYAINYDQGKSVIKVPVGVRVAAQSILASNVSQIPRQIASASTESDFIHYRVRVGDSLGLIARRFRTTVERLRVLNNLSRRALIRVGQRLMVPDMAIAGQAWRSEADRAKGPVVKRRSRQLRPTEVAFGNKVENNKVYRVRRGDTLFDIARRYNVTLNSIQESNNLSRRSRIFAGTELIIPD